MKLHSFFYKNLFDKKVEAEKLPKFTNMLRLGKRREHIIQGPRSYFESGGGGGGGLTSDSKWGSWKHLFLSSSLKFPQKCVCVCGGGGGGEGGWSPPAPPPSAGPDIW